MSGSFESKKGVVMWQFFKCFGSLLYSKPGKRTSSAFWQCKAVQEVNMKWWFNDISVTCKLSPLLYYNFWCWLGESLSRRQWVSTLTGLDLTLFYAKHTRKYISAHSTVPCVCKKHSVSEHSALHTWREGKRDPLR